MNIRDSEDASDFILSRHDFSTPVNNVRPLFAVSTSPSTPRRQTLEENEEIFRTILITTPTNTPEQHRNDGQTPSIFRTPGFSQLSSNQSRNSLLLTPTANTNQRVPFTPVRNYELRSCRGGSKTSLLRQVPEIPTPKIPQRQEDPPSPCSPGGLLFVPQMGAGGDMNIVVQKMEGNGKVKSYQCRRNDNSGEDEDAVVPNLEISISSSEASQNELAVWPVKKRRKRYLV